MEASEKRPYRQTARAEASKDLRKRIILAFQGLLLSRWIDEATLDEAAAAAGTTRRTVIRLFGGKDGLLEEVLETLHAQALPRLETPVDVSLLASLDALLDHYEQVGDFVMRLLAQEERHPALRPTIDYGRRAHRAWVVERFDLEPASAAERTRLVNELVVATDIYTWKLLRRDFGLSRKEVARTMADLITRLTGGCGA